MKRFIEIVLAMIIVASMVVFLAACGNSDIIGTWEVESGALSYQGVYGFVFNKDNSCYMNTDGTIYEGTYKIQGKELIMSMDNGNMYRFSSFSVVGDSLMLSYRAGNYDAEQNTVLKKVKGNISSTGRAAPPPEEPPPAEYYGDDSSAAVDDGSGKYTVGSDFYNGLAWVRTDRSGWRCIDKAGVVLFSLGSDDAPASYFSPGDDGAALVYRADGTLELINKKGITVSTPKSEAYDEIYGFLPDVGMILVRKHVYEVSFEETVDEMRAGVINSLGDWQVELSNNENLLRADNIYSFNNVRYVSADPTPVPADYYSGDEPAPAPEAPAPDPPPAEPQSAGVPNNSRTYYYLGDGLFYCNFIHQDAQSFYSVITGEIYTPFPVETKSVDGWDYVVDKHLEVITKIENDYSLMIVFIYDSYADVEPENSLRVIDSLGKTQKVFDNIATYDRIYIGTFSDDVFYFFGKLSKNDVANLDEVPYNQGFFDITGKQIIDLSEYELHNLNTQSRFQSIAFDSGYCLLKIKNPQGTPFYTVIDKTGNTMFEPRLLESDVSMKCGMIVIRNDNGSYTVFNAQGETVADFNNASVSDYSDDVALVKPRQGGEIYYIDKEGNRLF